MDDHVKQVTALLLVGALALVGLFDTWLAVTQGRAATISALTTSWAHRYPALPFAAGCLVAHLFGF